MVSGEFVRRNPNLPKRTYGTAGGWPLLPRKEGRHRNVLDIEELDTPIYRTFSPRRLLEAITSRTLVLVRPKLWQDPFENLLLQTRVRLNAGPVISIADLHDRYFGQCWTLEKESDALWRIYSPTTTGLKVRTTVRRLFNALHGQNTRTPELALFLGLVRYLPPKQLEGILANQAASGALLLDSTGIGQVRTLLLKRYEFSHESEVRLIFRETRRKYDRRLDRRAFSIDPNNLFDEVVFDPRVKPRTAARLQGQLRRAGYTGQIVKSELYKFSAAEVSISKPGPRPLGARTWYELRAGKLSATDWR